MLVVEDNTDAAETLRDILDLGGNEVAIAHSGPEALELAHRFKPDVVLSDIGLPGMDGYGVARALRADPELRAAFLVALSGYAQPEDLRKSKEAGFDRHLSKPASLDALNKMIAEAPVLGGQPKPAGQGAPGR